MNERYRLSNNIKGWAKCVYLRLRFVSISTEAESCHVAQFGVSGDATSSYNETLPMPPATTKWALWQLWPLSVSCLYDIPIDLPMGLRALSALCLI